MNNLTKRLLLFLIGCIGVRLLLVVVAKKSPPKYLPYLGYLALLPAIGFFCIYAFGLRKTGAEVFGDRIWWNSLRPVHGVLYALFAYHAIRRHEYAWTFLLADVGIGLVSFLAHHFGGS